MILMRPTGVQANAPLARRPTFSLQILHGRYWARTSDLRLVEADALVHAGPRESTKAELIGGIGARGGVPVVGCAGQAGVPQVCPATFSEGYAGGLA